MCFQPAWLFYSERSLFRIVKRQRVQYSRFYKLIDPLGIHEVPNAPYIVPADLPCPTLLQPYLVLRRQQLNPKSPTGKRKQRLLNLPVMAHNPRQPKKLLKPVEPHRIPVNQPKPGIETVRNIQPDQTLHLARRDGVRSR